MLEDRKDNKTHKVKLRKRNIPLRIIKLHITKLSNYQPSIEEQEARMKNLLNKFDKMFAKAVVQDQVDQIRLLARDLFAEGAYMDVINRYNQAAFLFLKFGFADEALSFSNDAKVLQKLVEARQMKIEVLAGALMDRNVPLIQTIYEDIIDISQKLNDFTSVDLYQSQLERLQHSQFDPNILTINQEIEVDPVQARMNQNTISNDFKIDQLKQKQLEIGQRAQFMERRSLFRAAGLLYKHCKKISLQLVEMGLEYERENVKRYQKEQEQCARRINIMEEVRRIAESRRFI